MVQYKITQLYNLTMISKLIFTQKPLKQHSFIDFFVSRGQRDKLKTQHVLKIITANMSTEQHLH